MTTSTFGTSILKTAKESENNLLCLKKKIFYSSPPIFGGESEAQRGSFREFMTLVLFLDFFIVVNLNIVKSIIKINSIKES
ncbi:MAG: hypothetical protein KAH48_08115 [Chlorobi bacterium]|nr:hypothetical protein [Chlorobiota bacterium]